ncbi:MAG: hypothetical protein WCH99_12135 [Verrucomicrobiota bacterium]
MSKGNGFAVIGLRRRWKKFVKPTDFDQSGFISPWGRQAGTLMKFISATKLMVAVFLCVSPVSRAEMGSVFQNCRPGDTVKVRCDHPMVVLGKATLLEIGSNTVTVCTASDRYTLDKSVVTLVPLASQSAPSVPAAAEPAVGSPDAKSLPGQALSHSVLPAGAQSPADIAQSMESVRASVIDPHKMEAFKEPKMVDGKWELVVNPGSKEGQAKYDKANIYYNQTMAGVMDGSVSQEELLRQAREVLALCDKYAPERKADPQYEKQIKTLREFVRRSEAGEKFAFPAGKP